MTHKKIRSLSDILKKSPLLFAVVLGLAIFLLGYTYLKNELEHRVAIHEAAHITLQKGLHDSMVASLYKDSEIHFRLFVLQPEVIQVLQAIASSPWTLRQGLQQNLEDIVGPAHALLKPMGLNGLYLHDTQLTPLLAIEKTVFLLPPAEQRPEILQASMERKPLTCFNTSNEGITLHHIFPILLEDKQIGIAEFVYSYDAILAKLKEDSNKILGYTDYAILFKKDHLMAQHLSEGLKGYKESQHLSQWLMPIEQKVFINGQEIYLKDLLDGAALTKGIEEFQHNLASSKPFAIQLPFTNAFSSLIFLPITGIQDDLQAYTVVLIPKDMEYMALNTHYKTMLLYLSGITILLCSMTYLLVVFQRKQNDISSFLSSMFASIPDGLLIVDSNWNIKDANEAACLILKYSREELIGQNPHYLLHYHGDNPISQEDCQVYKAITQTGSYSGETELKTKDGRSIDVHLSCKAFFVTGQNTPHHVIIFRDISEQVADKRELLASSNFYSMLMDITTLFLTTDHKRMDETIHYSIGQIAQFFKADRCYLCHFSEDYEFLTASYSWHRNGLNEAGVSCLEAVKRCSWFIDRLFRQQAVYISSIDQLPASAYCERDAMIKGQISALVLIPVIDNAITTGCYAFEYMTPQKFTEDFISRMVFATDIITNALYKFRFERQLVQLATTDGLTGLFNRRHFLELAEKEAQTSLRYKTPLSLIMFDIDHFKQINDSFGHAIGDEVLRELAKRVRQTLRETDFAGRLGGEEFAVICHVSPQNAYILAERLRKAMEEACVVCGEARIPFTISLGVAGLTGEIHDLTGLLKCADDALYQAKNAGRNQTRIWGE